jgi:ATP-dependent Clp protease protease subunit
MNELTIYGDIGESFWGASVSAVDVKDMLSEMDGDITVRINSAGGSVFDGFAIYNLLAQHDGQVHVKVDGWAASAASVIAMAGDTIEMADNSMIMIHEPWTMAVGDSRDMVKTAELLDKIRDNIITTYQSKSNLDTETISAMMIEETWMKADEAIEKGFATAKTSQKAKASNSVDKPWMNKAPQNKEHDMSFVNVQRLKLKLLQADA